MSDLIAMVLYYDELRNEAEDREVICEMEIIQGYYLREIEALY